MPVYWGSSAGLITSAGSGLISELAVCRLAMTWLGADPSQLNDVSTITTSSTKEETLCNVVYGTCRRAVIEDHNWQFSKKFQQLTLADGYDEAGFVPIVITGITQADPAVVSAAAHGFLDGQLVRIIDVSGMTQINSKVVRVANKNAGDFECYGLNSTKFDAYVSGGEVVRFEALADYQRGYAYRVPADMLKPVAIDPKGQFEVVGAGDDQRLLCNFVDPVLEYVADITVVSSMPDHFKRAWAARIAAELAPALQKKGSGLKDMWSHYEMVKHETKKSDSKNADATNLIRDGSPTAEAGGWE